MKTKPSNCYYPIYIGMETAASNNIVAVSSTTNPITGEVKLSTLTQHNGALVPTEVAANPNLSALIGLIFIQVLFVTIMYGPIAAYLVAAITPW